MNLKMRKGWAVLLMAALLVSLMPTAAFADDSVTGGIDVTAENYVNGTGYTWNAASKTLTLKNVTLNGDGTGVGIQLPNGAVTIRLEGENSIKNFKEGIMQGPVVESNSLKITGSGTLSISDCTYLSSGSIYDLTIDGAKLCCDVVNGLVMNGDFTAKNGAYVDITVGQNNPNLWNTIYANGNIRFYDSTLISHSGATGGLYVTGYKKDGPVEIRFVNSTITLDDDGWGAVVGSKLNPDGNVYIEDSVIYVNAAAGLLASNGAELAGDVQFITESNRQLLRTDTGEITLNLGEDAVFQGYINEKGTEVTFATDYVLTEDYTVLADRTLTVPEGVTLSLGAGVKITKEEGAKIVNNGTILVPCTEENREAFVTVDEGNEPEEGHCSPDGTWQTDEESHWQVCSAHNQETMRGSHHFRWVTDKEATATESGLKHEECATCGYAKAAVEIPAKGTTGGGSSISWYIVDVPETEHGTVAASGIVIPYGGSVTLTITPETGYRVKDVLINGESVGAVESYTIDSVQEYIKVDAVFEEIAADSENADLIKAIKNLKLTARSKLTAVHGKKAVRVHWYAKDGTKLADYDLDGYQVFRSEKKNSGYGKKPFFETKNTYYYNTKSLKKGTRYFYKVRGFKKIDGKTYYTGWSLKAWRLVK